MKLEALRARLRSDGCACCDRPMPENELIEHAPHKPVCAWCRETCYDILLGEYDHAQRFLRSFSGFDEMKCACCKRYAENASVYSAPEVMLCEWCNAQCGIDVHGCAFIHSHGKGFK